MNRTSIEWVRNPDGNLGWTWNPITGCLNHKDGFCNGGGFKCYAYRLANGRLRERYLANHHTAANENMTFGEIIKTEQDPFYPRFWDLRLVDPYAIKKPCGIFTVDMGELFGDGIPEDWQEKIFAVIKTCPQHRFYLLTKQPQNLIKFSPYPPNVYLGVTVTNQKMLDNALHYLKLVDAKVKFISFEPLLQRIDIQEADFYPQLAEIDQPLTYSRIMREQKSDISWLIIGACTGRKAEMSELVRKYPDLTVMPYGKIWTAQPKIEWVEEIVRAADQAGIPVFLKDNLKPLFTNMTPEQAGYFYRLVPRVVYSDKEKHLFNAEKLRQEFP